MDGRGYSHEGSVRSATAAEKRSRGGGQGAKPKAGADRWCRHYACVYTATGIRPFSPQGCGMTLALAIDLGGTKIEAALVDGRGRLVEGSRHRTPTGAGAAADVTVLDRGLAEVIDGCRAHPRWARSSRRAIGAAGPVDVAAAPSRRSTFPPRTGFASSRRCEPRAAWTRRRCAWTARASPSPKPGEARRKGFATPSSRRLDGRRRRYRLGRRSGGGRIGETPATWVR